MAQYNCACSDDSLMGLCWLQQFNITWILCSLMLNWSTEVLKKSRIAWYCLLLTGDYMLFCIRATLLNTFIFAGCLVVSSHSYLGKKTWDIKWGLYPITESLDGQGMTNLLGVIGHDINLQNSTSFCQSSDGNCISTEDTRNNLDASASESLEKGHMQYGYAYLTFLI